MKCANCGIELANNAKFCPECGTKAVVENVCSKCGTKLEPSAKFCPECGARFGEVAQGEAFANETDFADNTPEETLLQAAEAGDTDAMVKLAELYFNEKKFDEIFKWAKKAAEEDCAEGQNWLGLCYVWGWSCSIDLDEAEKWYLRAVEQGNEDAMGSLSSLHLSQENYASGFKWAKKAAEAGNAVGQFFLGRCYENGWGCVKNLDEAKKWYLNAAEAGDSDAMVCLAGLYCDEKNYASGFRWAKKAAEAGNATGQACLGICYENGWGCVKNLDEAKEWYNKAAEQGNEEAIEALNKIQKGIERKETLKKIGGGALDILGGFAAGVLEALADDDDDYDYDDD